MAWSAAVTAPLLWVGGTGGSGTRAVVAALAAAGFFPGASLNASGDSLPMVAVYDLVVSAHLAGRGPDGANWRSALDKALAEHCVGAPPDAPVVVKNPRAILIVELLLAFPGSRFVQVIRNGIDMAFSSNQRQLALYGDLLLGAPAPGETMAARSLRLWCAVNRRAAEIAGRYPGRCALLRYEDLCVRPRPEVARIGAELGLVLDPAGVDADGLRPVHRVLPENWRQQLGDSLAEAAPELAGFGYSC